MIENLLIDYLPIAIFLVIALALAILLVVIPFVVARIRGDREKISAYECGFEAFGDARMPFDVRFYLISILFIIFDLEIAFLFPWAIVLKSLPDLGFWSMMFFLFVLTVGFIYEWRRGALNWK
jgi:NADH-quinone oxidoreductase subunit A